MARLTKQWQLMLTSGERQHGRPGRCRGRGRRVFTAEPVLSFSEISLPWEIFCPQVLPCSCEAVKISARFPGVNYARNPGQVMWNTSKSPEYIPGFKAQAHLYPFIFLEEHSGTHPPEIRGKQFIKKKKFFIHLWTVDLGRVSFWLMGSPFPSVRSTCLRLSSPPSPDQYDLILPSWWKSPVNPPP